MGRKDILKYTPIITQSGASAIDTRSNPTCIDYIDNISIQLIWTGSLAGEFKVWVSDDQVNPKQGQQVTNWTQIDFGSLILVDATNTSLIINLNQNPFSFIAFTWTPASGTGNVTAQMSARMLGA